MLATRVDLWYSSKWNDVTTSVLTESGIRIVRGWTGESGGVDPSSADLTFKSSDGRFSPDNPESPLYGLIGKNTPVRVGCGRPPVAATARGAGGTTMTAPSVVAEATGVQLLFAFARPAGNISTPATFTAGTERDGTLSTGNSFRKTGVAAGTLSAVSITHSTTLTGWAAATVHIPGASAASVLASANTTGGNSTNANFATTGNYLVCCVAWSGDRADQMLPPEVDTDLGRGWDLLADTGPSTSASQPRMMVWGTRTNGAQTSAYTYGALDDLQDQYVCFVDVTAAADWSPRFTGYVSEWPQEWDEAEALVKVPVQAAGVSRRLSQNSPTVSPVRAANLTRGLFEYWPLEEASGASSFVNLLGGSPMQFAGAPVLSSAAIQGSDRLPTFTAAGAQAPVRPYSGVDDHSALCIFRCPDAGTAVGANILQMQFEGGTFSSLTIEYKNSTTYTLKLAYNDGGVTLSGDLSALPSTSHGRVFLVILDAYEGTGSGPVVSAAMVPLDTNSFDVSTVSTITSSPLGGDSVGRCTRVTVGMEGVTGALLNTNAPAIGHVAFIGTAYPTTIFGTTGDEYAFGTSSIRSLWGWTREFASYRLTRLARNNRVKLQGTYVPDSHGASTERTAPIMDKLRAAAAASPGSQLYEAAGFAGFVFKHAAYLEAAPRLTLAYTSTSGRLEPTDDDLQTANAVTATSNSGNIGRYVDAASQAAVGEYEKGLSLDLFTPLALQEAAAWAVRLGTVEGYRWPAVEFDLMTQTSLQALVYGWLDIGDRIDFTGVPAFAGADKRLSVRGMEEFIAPHTHRVRLVCSPGAVWDVARLDGDFFVGDDGGVALAEDLTTGEVGVDYSGTLFDPPTSGDYYDIRVAGETMEVQDTAGTMLVVRSRNGIVKNQSTGTRVEVVAPYVGY